MLMQNRNEPEPDPADRRLGLARRWQLAQRASRGECWDNIAALLEARDAICCRRCGSKDWQRESGSRTVYCRSCGKRSSITAGTLFHGVHDPELLLYLLQLHKDGIHFNAYNIHEITGIAYSTVRLAVLKIAWSFHQNMTNTTEARSRYFLPVVSKRSRATPAFEHPECEEPEPDGEWRNNEYGRDVEDIHQAAEATDVKPMETLVSTPPSHDAPNADQQELAYSNEELEQQILSLLSTTPVSTDYLASNLNIAFPLLCSILMVLELNSIVERLPGDRYVLAKTTTIKEDISPTLVTACNSAMAFIAELYDGVSRKYLHFYLAMHWAYQDRASWKDSGLIANCIARGKITYREIIGTVCPLIVHVFSDPTPLTEAGA